MTPLLRLHQSRRADIPSCGKNHAGSIGVDHMAYAFGSVAERFENYAHRKTLGSMPYGCIQCDITVSMYYTDPNGNQMEFQVDCCDDNDEANAFIG